MSNATLKWMVATVCLAMVGTAPARGEDAAEAKMDVIAKGAMQKLGGYRPPDIRRCRLFRTARRRYDGCRVFCR